MGSAKAPSRAGEVLGGKYRLQERLAVGGMGEVYRAVNEVVGRPVAIKLLKRELCHNEEVVRRFLREGRTSNRVDHKNIVKVIDVDQDGDQLFIVQDLLEGEDLSNLLKRSGRRIGLEELLDIVTPVADALGAAHAAGLVHRDLKPGNIFLAQVRGRRVPMVLDFGIAKVIIEDPEDNTPLHTKTGTSMGTPAYMSPEQIMAPKEVDARSDVWALGVLMFRSLAGQLPFAKESPGGLMVAICTEKPRSINSLVEGVPDVIAEVLAGCLARDPDERFANGAAVARALEGAREVLAEEISGYQIKARTSQSEPQRVSPQLFELELETPPSKRSVSPHSTTRPKASSLPPESTQPTLLTPTSSPGDRLSGLSPTDSNPGAASSPAISSGAPPASDPSPEFGAVARPVYASRPPMGSNPPPARLSHPGVPARVHMGSSGSRMRPPIAHARLGSIDDFEAEPGNALPRLGLALVATTPLVILGWSFRARGGVASLAERLGGNAVLLLAVLVGVVGVAIWRRELTTAAHTVAAAGFGVTSVLGLVAGATIVNGGTPASWLGRPGGIAAAVALGALAWLAGLQARRHFENSPVHLPSVISYGLAVLVTLAMTLRLVL